METNLRLAYDGTKLQVAVKQYMLVGQNLEKKDVERFCTILGRDTGVPAAPVCIDGKWNAVITEQRYEIRKREFLVDDWVIKVESTNKQFVIHVSRPDERQMVIDLYKRSFLIQVAAKSGMWTLGSPRIFYERDPFLKNDFVKKFNNVTDIQGFRRYELSEQYVEGVGLGFSVHVGTAFFTSLTVDDYFRAGHEERFKKLAGRQREQKGTLMYDGPYGRQVCYFEEYCWDKSLINSGAINGGGDKRYDNLFAYYQQTAPNFPVKAADKVAIVSFSGMNKKSMVPANKLYLRVTNEALDRQMSQRDKIDPQERSDKLSKFWKMMGRNPFGNYLVSISNNFYRPDHLNSGRIELHDLLFGNNARLVKPAIATDASYKRHYNDRKKYLDQYGCYYVPPTMATEIHFAFPKHVPENVCDLYFKNVCDKIYRLTGVEVEPITYAYESYEDMALDLTLASATGIVVFAFDDVDSVTYFNIRRNLKNWQLKRLTTHELKRNYKNYRDYKDGRGDKRAERNWEGYIDENVYDIIQQMGCLPYIIEPKLNYDMQLVIDVSAKSTHLALSLFMFKEGMRIPVWGELIKPKTDAKQEEINPVFLETYLKELIIENKDLIKAQQMRSLLVLRDGKDCGEEFKAIRKVLEFFKEKGLFAADFKFDFVEYHKSSLKQLRIWERNGHMTVNCLEGSYFAYDSQSAILAATGAGTLNQGTAAPVMIKNKYTGANIKAVLSDIFVTSQLNYSSPRVAQRLTFSAKRTDEQLKDRTAQEIIRIK